MKNMNTPHRRCGFKLIELIVVIAVLLIGAAILFPVFQRARDNSKKSVCPNNLNQIVLGFKQYINDFDEHYPLVAVTDAITHDGVPPYGWADAIQPYIRNTQVYQCPSDSSDAPSANDTTDTPNFCDYWYNANFGVHSKNKKGAVIFIGASESDLGSAAQTIVAGDGGNTIGTPTGDARYNQCGDGSSLSGRNQSCAPAKPLSVNFFIASYPSANIHLGGAYFAFADGHVKWVRANNESQSAGVWSNGATQKTIGGKVTFSLLHK